VITGAEVQAVARAPVAATVDSSRGPDRLREASEQLEGLFVQYLTKALRATIPNGGNPDAPGADLYSSLLDEHLAQVVANDTRTGIAEALYRQFTGITQDPPREGRDV
jgi:peptidoglycan hydrolase FlgJ